MKKYTTILFLSLLSLTGCTQNKTSSTPVPTLHPYNPSPISVLVTPLPTTESTQSANLRSEAQKAMTAFLEQYKSPKKFDGKQLQEYKINTLSNVERNGKELRFYVDYSIKVASQSSEIIGTDNGNYDSATGWVTYKHGQASFTQKTDGTYTFNGITTGSGGS